MKDGLRRKTGRRRRMEEKRKKEHGRYKEDEEGKRRREMIEIDNNGEMMEKEEKWKGIDGCRKREKNER